MVIVYHFNNLLLHASNIRLKYIQRIAVEVTDTLTNFETLARSLVVGVALNCVNHFTLDLCNDTRMRPIHGGAANQKDIAFLDSSRTV